LWPMRLTTCAVPDCHSGNLDLLKFDDLSPEERQESLKAVEAEIWRMASVVSDLAVLAEIESGHLEQQEDVSLKKMLLDTREWAGLLAGHRRIIIGARMTCGREGPPVGWSGC